MTSRLAHRCGRCRGRSRGQGGTARFRRLAGHQATLAGHRLGTAEIESALVSHPAVAESAVVGMPHEIKGTGITAFVTLKAGAEPSRELKTQLERHVIKEIGAIARPDRVRFTDTLPKTRSGKIMRRLLREIAGGSDVKGDTTTLEDFSALARLQEEKED